jgi:YecR-like lipoprotein
LETDFISRVFVISVCIALASCAIPKTPEATGGSRADGTVKLSYEVNRFEKPIVQWDVAEQTATDKCRNWGYQSAEKFGGAESHCEGNGYGGCDTALVTMTYQCIGSLTSK